MSQSLLFCQIVESEYNASVNSIETLIGVPSLALRALKGYIKRFEFVVLAGVEGRLRILEDLLNQLWQLTINATPFDRFSTKNICQLAYTCLALREHFLIQTILQEKVTHHILNLSLYQSEMNYETLPIHLHI